MPRRLRVDMDGLVKAIGCTSLAQEAFLDLIRGTVIVLGSGDHDLGYQDSRFAQYKAQPNRYRHIPHASQRELYKDMLDFTATVDDPEAKAELTQVLSGKSSVPRFYSALETRPPLTEHWRAFHHRRLLERARRWLAHEGIVADSSLKGQGAG